MSNITLNGYETLILNAVYGKDTGIIVANGSGRSVGIKEIILPKVYVEATENDVIAYLQKKAAELYSAATIVLPPGHKREGSILDQAMKELPKKIFLDLINKDENLENFIRKNTQAPENQKSSKYLYEPPPVADTAVSCTRLLENPSHFCWHHLF